MTPRKYPKRMPADWEPNEPAFEATFPDDFSVVVTYLGVQGAPSTRDAVQREWVAALSREGGAPSVECAVFTDAAGVVNDVVIAYWRTPADEGAFWDQSDLAAWWNDDTRLQDNAGYWRESFVVPRERLETLISSEGYQTGVAKLSNGVSGPIREHGYRGAARDRITGSAEDDFSGGARSVTPHLDPETTRKRRVHFFAPRDLCVIRSGQDWSRCSDEESAYYHREVAPTLEAGMNFLRDEGHNIGCYACRFMQEISPAGDPNPRTFGLAYFGDLDQLETWADRHPTHLAILDKFLKLLQATDFQLGLTLWHEVLVLPHDTHVCEYINCHGMTGFLPYVDMQ